MIPYDGHNKNLLKNVAATRLNPKWDNFTSRLSTLYCQSVDIRSPFERDYTRILYSNAYKRLKNKTQVFFSPSNDHVCTRIEHVNNVESISYTIANELGLNVELTRAISIAHDLGHSPFGHQGEKILNAISKRDCDKTFWHEKNGLMCVDNIDLLNDDKGFKENLNLTYAVRDGIISHCGELDQSFIKPREEFIDLEKDYTSVAQFEPYTWEACVVKIADKISYVGRDIEDAVRFNILSDSELLNLKKLLNSKDENLTILNNRNIINELIGEVLNYVTIENGFTFSSEGLNVLNNIKKFNYEHIYGSNKLMQSHKYFELVINTIYDLLKSIYDESSCKIVKTEAYRLYPDVIKDFLGWLNNYSKQTYFAENKLELTVLKNNKIFNIDNPKDYYYSIILYISGMTDNKAINTFEKIISF